MATTATVPTESILDTTKNALSNSFTEAANQLFSLAPRVIAMVAVLVIGYVIAKLVARVTVLVSEKLGLQIAAERSGLAESMAHTNIGRNVPAIIGTIVFWLMMCVFIMAAFSTLNIGGLEPVSEAMSRVVNYIPNLLAAAVVVVVGLLAASFVRGVVATSADRVRRAPGQRLLLRAGHPDPDRGLLAVGPALRVVAEPDSDRRGRPGHRLRPGFRPGRS
jgi:hypothetical protein